MIKILYLAGPMLGCTDLEMHRWRNAAKRMLPEWICLDPTRRDYRGKDVRLDAVHCAALVNNDKDDINQSNIVLVYHDRPSVGTSMEVLYAFDRKKVIIIINKVGPEMSPWMYHHATYVVHSLEEAVEKISLLAIRNFDNRLYI